MKDDPTGIAALVGAELAEHDRAIWRGERPPGTPFNDGAVAQSRINALAAKLRGA